MNTRHLFLLGLLSACAAPTAAPSNNPNTDVDAGLVSSDDENKATFQCRVRLVGIQSEDFVSSEIPGTRSTGIRTRATRAAALSAAYEAAQAAVIRKAREVMGTRFDQHYNGVRQELQSCDIKI